MVVEEKDGLLRAFFHDVLAVVSLGSAVDTECEQPHADEHACQQAYGCGYISACHKVFDGKCQYNYAAHDDDGQVLLVAVSHKAAEPHKFLFGESCLYTV
jgi:hypothetical protein